MAISPTDLYLNKNDNGKIHADLVQRLGAECGRKRVEHHHERRAGNGFDAWRLLHDAYEPKIGGRHTHTHMLMGVISTNVKEADFMEALDDARELWQEGQAALRTSSLTIGTNQSSRIACRVVRSSTHKAC